MSKMYTNRRKTADKEIIELQNPEKETQELFVNDFCRTCLNKTNLTPLFSQTNDERCMVTNLFTDVEIKKNDLLSQYICNKCIVIINVILKFREKCKKTEQVLLGMIKNNVKKEIDEYCTEPNNMECKKLATDYKDSNTVTVAKRKIEVKVEISTLNEGSKDENNITTESEKDTEPIERRDNESPVSLTEDQTECETIIRNDRCSSQLKSTRAKTGNGLKSNNRNFEPFRTFIRALPPGPPYECPECLKVYQMKYKYLRHKHVDKIVCEDCGKIFPNNFALQQHQRAKHGFAKFQCPHCTYTSATQEAMRTHSRHHTGERPYVCDHCGAGFLTRRTLTQHLGVHQPPSIQCPFCPKKLKSMILLTNHKSQHMKTYRFPCPLCRSQLSSSKACRRHLAGVHAVPRRDQPLTIGKVLVCGRAGQCAATLDRTDRVTQPG